MASVTVHLSAVDRAKRAGRIASKIEHLESKLRTLKNSRNSELKIWWTDTGHFSDEQKLQLCKSDHLDGELYANMHNTIVGVMSDHLSKLHEELQTLLRPVPEERKEEQEF